MTILKSSKTASTFNTKTNKVSQAAAPTPSAKSKTSTTVVAKKGDSFTDTAGRTGVVGFSTKTGKPLAEEESTDVSIPTGSSAKVTPKSSIINTSTQSKSNYAENVNTMNTANENLRQVQAGQTASGIAASLGMTPEAFLKINPNFAASGSVNGTKGDYKGMEGTIQPGMTYKIGPDGTPNPVEEKPEPDVNGNITTNDPDGTTTTTDSEGNVTITNERGDLIDPTIKKLLNDNIDDMTQAALTAKKVMDDAAKTLKKNPAAQIAAQEIKDKYDILIRQMEEKNRMLLGGIGKNSARTGMLQYANEMDSNFKSMEFDKSVQRIADLHSKENAEIAKSNAAFKSGDVKAFDAASKEYNKALQDKQDAILDLNKAMNDAVKQNDAEIKQLKTDQRNALTDNIKIAGALARDIAMQLKGSKDPTGDLTRIAEAVNEKYGIELDLDILSPAVTEEMAKIDKEELTKRNINSIIDNRGGNGTGDGKKYTATNIPEKIKTELLDDLKGGKATKDDLFRLYPEVSTSYVSSLYNQYHTKSDVVNPFSE